MSVFALVAHILASPATSILFRFTDAFSKRYAIGKRHCASRAAQAPPTRRESASCAPILAEWACQNFPPICPARRICPWNMPLAEFEDHKCKLAEATKTTMHVLVPLGAPPTSCMSASLAATIRITWMSAELESAKFVSDHGPCIFLS